MPTFGFHGAAGALAEDALLQLLSTHPSFAGEDHSRQGFGSIRSLFENVQRGNVIGIIALENSLSGTIHSTLEMLVAFEPKVWIVGEYNIAESNSVMAIPGTRLQDIHEVRSHPAVLEQCRAFLESSFPDGFKAVQCNNTATAAQEVEELKQPGVAALAGKRAAELHNLEILATDFAPNNVTRYVLISREPLTRPDRSMSPQSSFAVMVKNQTGALHRICACFALRNIGITRLESRPSSRTISLSSPWEYVIYVTIEGAPGNNDNVQKAFENLKEFSQTCVHLGSYPRFLPPSSNPSGIIAN